MHFRVFVDFPFSLFSCISQMAVCFPFKSNVSLRQISNQCYYHSSAVFKLCSFHTKTQFNIIIYIIYSYHLTFIESSVEIE
jgi:hypothetical protein